MARKKDEGGAAGGARLTPVDVQQIQFRRALRGYDEQEVDDFLDRVTEELTLLIDERRSLSDRAGSLPTVRVSSAGAAAASAEAEEIIRQARERADAIIREANQRAAAIVREAESRGVTGAAAAAGGSGAAIGMFVSREREFLQQLASLVQGHAENVKGMVASARDTGAASTSTPAAGGSAGPSAPAPAGSTSGGTAAPAPSTGDAGSGAGSSGPVVVPEAESGSAAGSAIAGAAVAESVTRSRTALVTEPRPVEEPRTPPAQAERSPDARPFDASALLRGHATRRSASCSGAG